MDIVYKELNKKCQLTLAFIVFQLFSFSLWLGLKYTIIPVGTCQKDEL